MKKYIILAMVAGCTFGLSACSTPHVATYTSPDGGKLIIAGSASLMEDSDYEEQDQLIKIPGVEVRLRSKKHGKRQTTTPNNYIMGEVTKFLATESTNVMDSNNARDVKLGAQDADVTKALKSPIVTGPEEFVTIPQ